MAETFKGPIVNSSRGVEIAAQTGSVKSALWSALGGSCSLAGQLQEPRSQVKADVATVYTHGCGFYSVADLKRWIVVCPRDYWPKRLTKTRMYVCFLSVSLSLWGVKPYPTYLSVCLYLYILYVCNQATSFDGVVPSGILPLYF